MNIKILGVAVIASMTASHAVHAGFLQLRDAPGGEHANGNPNGPLVPGTGSTLNGTYSNGSNGPMYVGTWALEVDFGSGFQALNTYCIEPNANITFGFHPDDTVGLPYQTDTLENAGFTALEASYMGILWANAFAISQTSAINAAAFQSVIWEWREDDSIDLITGNFRLNPDSDYSDDVRALAQSWIDNIVGGTWTQSVQLIALTNDNSQDFVMPVVPSAGVLPALLLGLAGTRRRR